MHVGSRASALEALRHLVLSMDSLKHNYSRSAEMKGAPESSRSDAAWYLSQLYASRKAQLVLARERLGADLAARISLLEESATTSRYHAVVTVFELWEGSAPLTCVDSLTDYRATNLRRFLEADRALEGAQRSPWREAWDDLTRAVEDLPNTVNGKPRKLSLFGWRRFGAR
ncbi:hypothetical protein BCR35DRAFT_79561 [Leucosporidium creatinivorum]|uniref:Uncharacterized protein n=1 Tax=Leucosporidium creatinivorum TaxID=106004 RepID=A0A1Y2FGB7_9BASI|nr:hypothetical protein BCR35DRAFT_79561 [Leucosporidium creatinivorum]